MKPKVLVVDDERAIAYTLAIILNKSGFEATAVYAGEEAVQTAKTFRPDVLISDVIMPGLNGIDAAIAIRKCCLPAKFCSCRGRTQQPIFSTRQGVKATISKLSPNRSRQATFSHDWRN